MKWINYLIGLTGAICLVATIALDYRDPDTIKVKNGPIYFTHGTSDKGYGFAISRNQPENKPTLSESEGEYGLRVTGLKDHARHRCVVFKGDVSYSNYAYPFHPVVVEIDNDQVTMHVSFQIRDREIRDQEYVSLSLCNDLDAGLSGYLTCTKTLSDRREVYIDVDGDYLPDKRLTHYKIPYPNGIKSTEEIIRYTYTNQIEQDGGGQPATRPVSK